MINSSNNIGLFIKFINIHYTNVHVILMFGNDFDKSGLSLEDANIFYVYNDSYIPGIFDKTLDCFDISFQL